MTKLEQIRTLGHGQIARLYGNGEPSLIQRGQANGTMMASEAESIAVLKARIAHLEGENLVLRERLERSEKVIPKLNNGTCSENNGVNKGTRGRPRSGLTKAERQRIYRSRKSGGVVSDGLPDDGD